MRCLARLPQSQGAALERLDVLRSCGGPGSACNHPGKEAKRHSDSNGSLLALLKDELRNIAAATAGEGKPQLHQES